jgi:hypothetical protein
MELQRSYRKFFKLSDLVLVDIALKTSFNLAKWLRISYEKCCGSNAATRYYCIIQVRVAFILAL